MSPLYVRRAEPEEHAPVMGLLEEVTRWLTARGIDQWQDRMEIWSPRVAASIGRGEVWVLVRQDDERLVGTLTLDDQPDPDFWHDSSDVAARYLHKLAVRRDVAGRELGRLLLDWARDRAARENAQVVRLDAWRSNPQLHAYYRNRGWTQVRTVDLDHRRSGALFSAPATRTPVWDRLAEVETLPTVVRRPEQRGADEAGNTLPDHIHVGGAQIILSGDNTPMQATWVPTSQHQLVSVGGRWILQQAQPTGYRPIVGTISTADIPLAPDLAYLIEHRYISARCRITTMARNPS